MKTHTQTFKDNLVTLGKEINAKVIYTINGVTTELNGDDLSSVTPHFEGNILKSVMKQVDIVSDIDIPLNTEINVQFGMRYDTETYEYIDYGNYIVFSSDRQEDTNNYKIIAYDKMLYAMKDYEELEITYPITIRDYIDEVCTKIGLEFANSSDIFANYDKEITQDLFKDLGYTYRDILDQLAQVTGSTICINKEDKLEIRYLNDNVNATQEVEGTNLTITNAEDFKIINPQIEGNTTQYTTTGKNLLPTNSFTLVKGSTRTIQINFPTPIPAGTYTISCKITNKSGLTGNGMGWALYDGATNRGSMGAITNSTTSPYKYTRTTTGQATHLYAYIDNSLGDDATITLDEIMLESGSTATTYEPYTNGASPNPNYPQPINNVTGLQEIDVRGKNLLNTSLMQEFTPNIVGWWGLDGVSSFYNETQIKKSKIYYDLKANTTYTFSVNFATNKSTSATNPIQLVNENGSSVIANISQNGSYTTFTPTSDVRVYPRMNIQSANTTTQCIVQLEVGNSVTLYEPYKGKSYDINLGKNLASDTTLKNGLWTSSTNVANNGSGWYVIEKCEPNTTYTISKKNTTGTIYANFTTLYPANGVATLGQNQGAANRKSLTITTPSNANYMFIGLFAGSPTDIQKKECIEELQLEKGSIATLYSPYFTPIELNKISTYKDYIFKGKGVNLFDKDSITNAYLNTDGTTTSSASLCTTDYIKVKPNTYYRINNMAGSHRGKFYNSSKERLSDTFNFNFGVNNIIQTSNDTQYIRFTYSNTLTDVLQVVEGQELFPYEPYNAKDKWLLHKEIGKVVLNGSEYWNYDSTNNVFINNTTLFNGQYLVQNGFSNYYKNIVNDTITGNYQAGQVLQNNQFSFRVGTKDRLYLKDTRYTNTTDYKTWLNTHNVKVYFVLNVPTTTEITNTELINQLNKLENAPTYEGQTNITSSFPIKLSYATDYETINEDYIKNTKAEFGEKYGPINSIVLSRSADTDNIYLQDEESIEENGLCEIKIKDNQIMNDNNRDIFLPDLLNKLNGFQYYINDFESIGITYLDLCDKYKVQIGDKKYDCVLFNDEVKIGDGLNEIIYTDKLEETQTDYKKASKSDKQERQTYLIVDKQNQKIEAVISESEDNFSRLQVEVDSISSEVQSTNTELDELGQSIEVLKSSFTEQTAEAITDWFNKELKPTIEDLENTTETNSDSLNAIKGYIRRGLITDSQSPFYNQPYVEIGDTTNQTTLRILPNRIQFLTNGQETAFISNNQLYINESTILTKEKVGHWVTTEDSDGRLNTYWED